MMAVRQLSTWPRPASSLQLTELMDAHQPFAMHWNGIVGTGGTLSNEIHGWRPEMDVVVVEDGTLLLQAGPDSRVSAAPNWRITTAITPFAGKTADDALRAAAAMLQRAGAPPICAFACINDERETDTTSTQLVIRVACGPVLNAHDVPADEPLDFLTGMRVHHNGVFSERIGSVTTSGVNGVGDGVERLIVRRHQSGIWALRSGSMSAVRISRRRAGFSTLAEVLDWCEREASRTRDGFETRMLFTCAPATASGANFTIVVW